MGVWTTAGLNLVASAVQSPGVNCAMTWAGISTGCGTISAGITAGVPITAITLDANVPVSLASGQSLTVTDGANTETVTTSANVTGGATATIPIGSWTPAHSYTAHSTGICPTPAAWNGSLYNESVRVAANIGAAGASAGESLTGAYFDGTQASALFLLVGFFGGSGATAAVGTGTLMVEDIQYWNHTANGDSNMYQADSTI